MKKIKYFIPTIMLYLIGMVAGFSLGADYETVMSYIVLVILFVYLPQIIKNEDIINDLKARIEFLEKLNNGRKTK